jgi:hypothetical protein
VLQAHLDKRLKGKIKNFVGLNLILDVILALEAVVGGVNIGAGILLASLERFEANLPVPNTLELRTNLTPIIVVVRATAAEFRKIA